MAGMGHGMDVNDSPQSAVARATPPSLEPPDLPPGWRSAEGDDWRRRRGHWQEARARAARGRRRPRRGRADRRPGVGRRRALRARRRGARRPRLLAGDHRILRGEPASSFRIATRGLWKNRPGRRFRRRSPLGQVQADRRAAVVAGLEDAAARLGDGDAAGVLAALTAIPAADLRATAVTGDAAREPADALAQDLVTAAEAALRRRSGDGRGASPPPSSCSSRPASGRRPSRLGRARARDSAPSWPRPRTPRARAAGARRCASRSRSWPCVRTSPAPRP